MQDTLYRSIHFCTGGSTGFTFATLFDLVSFQTVGSAVAFLGSASFTAFSWYLSRKAELLRIERETAAADLAFKRQQELADIQHTHIVSMAKLLNAIEERNAAQHPGMRTDDGHA